MGCEDLGRECRWKYHVHWKVYLVCTVFTEHLPHAQHCFGCWDSVGDRIAKAYAHTEVRSSHNLLIDGAVGRWEGKKKIAAIKNNGVFRKEEVMLMGSHCPLNPPPFPSINNRIKLRD